MKKVVKALVIALCVFAVPVCSSFHLSASYEKDVEFTEESIERLDYETGEDSPYAGEFLTYTVDENNNIVRLEDNGVATQSLKNIRVYIGSTIVGYLTATVIDGIVISATCQSGAWWVSQAIQNVLKRKYSGITYVNCNVYPMHSYEGAMCRKYA